MVDSDPFEKKKHISLVKLDRFPPTKTQNTNKTLYTEISEGHACLTAFNMTLACLKHL